MGRRFGSKNGMGTGSTRMSRHTGGGRYGSGGRKASIHVPTRPFWTTKKWKQKPLSAKIFDIVVMLAGLAIILVVTMFLVNGTKNGNNNNENVTSLYSSNSKKKKNSFSRDKNEGVEGTEGTKVTEEENTDTMKSRTIDSSREESIAREESIGRSHRENGISKAENNSREYYDADSISSPLHITPTPKRNQDEYPNLPSQEAPQQSQSNNTSTQPAQNNAN